MTPEELVKLWKDDTAEHAIVWAHDWSSRSRGVRCLCEGCGRPISVWPVVADKRAANPRMHVLCRAKCMAICLKVNGPMPFGGQIKDNALPEGLEKFGNVPRS